ncbi:hypothetical protein [Nocardioides caldifontis]|uniref:hypothetical protein n=1 Tax=Nocardioides caldifontis TaxID=2588938 RepID=UPI0011E0219A|nr:hypothetical protein [Nocardioides caldifontis]
MDDGTDDTGTTASSGREKRDVELDAAAKAISKDVSEDSDEQEPTTEDSGPMTPTVDSVTEANAEGVNPDK